MCPTCLAGGETTDFSGDRECSDIDATPVYRSSPVALEFALEDLLARLEQPIRTSFEWRRQPGGAAATGYERQTEVELQFEVLEVSHGEWLNGGRLCDDFLVIDARIHLQTTDGAFGGSFERRLLLPRGASAAHVDYGGEIDPSPELRDFIGTLDLGLDAERIYDGSVAITFSVGPEEMRGRLGIDIWYRGRDGSRSLFTPLEAHWPAEGCAYGWRRVDPDASLHSDGRTARDHWQQTRSRLAEAFPAAASWLDVGQTEIDLQPGALEVVCQNWFSPAAYYLATPLHIRSADGRLETTQPAQLHFRTDDVSMERLTVEGEATARDALAPDVSVSGLDWANTSEATFQLQSRLASDATSSGDLQVFGFDTDGREFRNLLYLHWCAGSECETYPSVLYSPGGPNGFWLPEAPR